MRFTTSSSWPLRFLDPKMAPATPTVRFQHCGVCRSCRPSMPSNIPQSMPTGRPTPGGSENRRHGNETWRTGVTETGWCSRAVCRSSTRLGGFEAGIHGWAAKAVEEHQSHNGRPYITAVSDIRRPLMTYAAARCTRADKVLTILQAASKIAP